VSARLRVAVPAEIEHLNPRSGVGTMWRHVLAGLAHEVDLRPSDPRRRRRWGARPHLWLSDCGFGALPVREPVVVQVHEAGWTDDDVQALFHPEFLEVVLEGRVGDAVRAAVGIVTPSASSRQQVIEHWDVAPERVHAVPHGVDADRFRPGRWGGEDLVAAAGGRAEVPYVLFVSQLHPRKNLAVLRAAMAALAADGFPHQLVVVGGAAQDRPDSAELARDAAADLPGAPGRVTLLQDLPEDAVADLMAGAAAFCLPSLMEGFGLTALEAMSCGAPVVVSDRGSLPEVVGEAGLVVPPTVDGVAGALAEVLGDAARAAELGAAARARAQTFTWSRTVAGWRAALEAAAREGRGG
jgi:glycosyltransferase involved in cell wall biosynthesis